MTFLKKGNHRGQSLLEAVVALGIITIVIMGLIRAGVVGVRNSSSSETQALTARYGTEAIEWLRNEESILGWASFSAPFNTVGDYYCLPNSPLTVSVSLTGALGSLNLVNCPPISGTGIVRKVRVVLTTPLELSVEETWVEGNNQRSVSYNAQFSPPANP